MSWSFSAIGSPDKVAEEFDRQAAAQTGQSKVEMEEAGAHIKGLLAQNFAKPGAGYSDAVVRLDASGSGSIRGAPDASGKYEQVQRVCKVTLEPLYTKLV